MEILVGLNTVTDNVTDCAREAVAGAVNRTNIDGAGVPVIAQGEAGLKDAAN